MPTTLQAAFELGGRARRQSMDQGSIVENACEGSSCCGVLGVRFEVGVDTCDQSNLIHR